MKSDSSDARNEHAEATSEGSHSLPRGTLDKNFALFAGVSETPAKDSNLINSSARRFWKTLSTPEARTHNPVPPNNGQTEFTRIVCGPNSAANPFVACLTTISHVFFPPSVHQWPSTHIPNRSFTSIVPHQPRPWPRRSHARHIDDTPSPSLLHQQRKDSRSAEINPLDIDIETFVEICLGDFQRRLFPL